MIHKGLSRFLRWSALLLLVGGLATWALTGANRGWTRTEATTLAVDEITGLEYPQTRQVFEPGLDFLAAALGLAAAARLGAWLLARGAAPSAKA